MTTVRRSQQVADSTNPKLAENLGHPIALEIVQQ